MIARQNYNRVRRSIFFLALAAMFAVGWGWMGLQQSYAGTDPLQKTYCVDGKGNRLEVEASPDLHDGALDTSFSNWFICTKDTYVGHRVEARGGGDVHLILGKGALLNATAGVRVVQGTTLHIYGQEAGSGRMIADARNHAGAAGIGGNPKGHGGGNIVIESGNIWAHGGHEAAGIGGSPNRSGGTITINGGIIYGQGGGAACGIGGGIGCHGPGITINGGDVWAVSGSHAAGIGGGRGYGIQGGGVIGGGDSGDITINGGKVYSTSYLEHGAGIGGGEQGECGNITINGGDIEAHASDGAAGIGSGNHAFANTITINGGKIKAYGGDRAAGIGSGMKEGFGIISVNGGDITAKGGVRGAGIGSGLEGEMGIIRINGIDTVINAEAGGNGAGIGSGEKGSGAKYGLIQIQSGKITAKGLAGGAGIGTGADAGNSGKIDISGGSIKAIGSPHSLDLELNVWKPARNSSSAGIGGGWKTRGGVIEIVGGQITAERATEGACCIGHGAGLSPEVYKDTSGFKLDWKGARVKSGSTVVKKAERDNIVFASESELFKTRAAGIQIEQCQHPLDWEWNENQHWKSCPYCLAVTEKSNMGGHTFSYKADGKDRNCHQVTCTTCGFSEKENHDIDIRTEMCSKCGIELQGVYVRKSENSKPEYLEGNADTKYQLPDGEKAGVTPPEGMILAGWYVGDRKYIEEPGDYCELNDGAVLTPKFAIPGKTIENLLKNGGTVRLDNDVVLRKSDAPIEIPAGIRATLDLNGHSVLRSGRFWSINALEAGQAFNVSGELTLEDSRGGGEIGNCATKEKAGITAGAVLVSRNGRFTMNGGTIKGNQTYSRDGAGGVSVDGGTFVMNGGSITQNQGEKSGAVYACNGGRVELRGGQITGNHSSFNWGAGGGGSDEPGAAVYMEDAAASSGRSGLILSGSASVRGNVAGSRGESNIRLAQQAPVTIDGALAQGSSFGIRLWSGASGTVTVTRGFDGNANPGQFQSDDPAWGIGISSKKEIVLGKGTAAVDFNDEAAAQEVRDDQAGTPDAGSGETGDQETKKGGSDQQMPAYQPLAAGSDESITAVKGQYYMLPPCTIEPPQGRVFRAWGIGNKEYQPTDIVRISGDTTVTPLWRDSSPGMVRVIVLSDENGTAIADAVESKQGEEINILAEPDYGYQLAGWKVIQGSVNPADPKDTWTFFTMGSSEVKIMAEFEPIPVEDVRLSQHDLILKEGQSIHLNAIVTPFNALDSEVTWDIAHSDTVSLKVDGHNSATIKGVAAGVTELLLTTNDNQGPASANDVTVVHDLVHHAAGRYTSTKPGNIEYWQCRVCGKYFADEDGYDEITREDTLTTCLEEDLAYVQMDEFYAKAEKAMAKKTKVTSVKAKKSRKAVVKWKKTTGISGYRVIYSTDKKMKKNVKTKNVKASAKKITLTKLKKGKRLYVSVQPFKNIKNAADGRTYRVYCQKSAKKSVRIRK